METLQKNQTVRAVIEGYSSEGLGIARVNGQVVFVHRAIRGEDCDILIMKVLKHAAFGKVTSGMDVVDAIASVQTDRSDRPQVEQKIASITVDTHGETYPEPNKLPDPYGRF